MKKYSVLLILLAGVLWGTMGIFVRFLGGYGFDSMQSAMLRLSSAAICLFFFLLWKDRRLFRIAPKDIVWFLGIGLGSILLMTVSYFYAISVTAMSVAAILLYTAPIMVTLMSALFFQEKLGGKKLLALFLAFLGCALVSGLGGGGRISALGIAAGLLSGFAYGLYSIFGTILLRRYHPYTVTFYAFLIAAAGSLLICRPRQAFLTLAGSGDFLRLLLLILLTGLVTAVLPFLFYTTGLKGTEPGRASIMASVEPMVAALLGIVFYHETLTFFSFLGMLLILGAVILLNLSFSREK